MILLEDTRNQVTKHKTKNNSKVICVERDNINMVREELLAKEVDNWGVDPTGRLLATMDKIFIDVKE